MPSLTIFDVGHGSCALLRDENQLTLFDCKDISLFSEYALENNIDFIDQLIVSHSDADHIAGISALLTSDIINVGMIYVNPDPTKTSESWRDLRIAIGDAVSRKGLKISTSVGSDMVAPPTSDTVAIEILAPGVIWQLTGAGGRLPNGPHRTDSNSMSVVIKLSHEGHPVALIPGDMDFRTLSDLIERGVDMMADILVFPHHGGHVSEAKHGEDRSGLNTKFTDEILRLVCPKYVIFSMGRGMHGTPRPEIISSISRNLPNCIISCTQLSDRCHFKSLPENDTHLAQLPAKGRKYRKCCSGTVELEFRGSDTFEGVQRVALDRFISESVQSPLCRSASSA